MLHAVCTSHCYSSVLALNLRMYSRGKCSPFEISQKSPVERMALVYALPDVMLRAQVCCFHSPCVQPPEEPQVMNQTETPTECFHGVLGYFYLAFNFPLSSERGVQSQSFQRECNFPLTLKTLHLHCRHTRKKTGLTYPFPHLNDLILHSLLFFAAH